MIQIKIDEDENVAQVVAPEPGLIEASKLADSSNCLFVF